MASTGTGFESFSLMSPSKHDILRLSKASSQYVFKHMQSNEVVKKRRMNCKPVSTCSRVLSPRHQEAPRRSQSSTSVSPNQTTSLSANSSENESPTSSAVSELSHRSDILSDNALEFVACPQCPKMYGLSLDDWMDHLGDEHPVPVKWPSSRAADLVEDQRAIPYTSVVGSHKKRKADAIPRPLNSFMIFAQYVRRVVLFCFPDAHNVHISQRVGQLWRHLPEDVRDQYVAEASRLQQLHSVEFPHYKYQPRKKSARTEHDSDDVDGLQTASPLTNVDDQLVPEWDSPLLRLESRNCSDNCYCSTWGECNDIPSEHDRVKRSQAKDWVDPTSTFSRTTIDQKTTLTAVHPLRQMKEEQPPAASDINSEKTSIGLICAQRLPNNQQVLMPATLISMRWPTPVPTEVIDRLNGTKQSDSTLTLLVSGPGSDATLQSGGDAEASTSVTKQQSIVKPSVELTGTSAVPPHTDNRSESTTSGTLEDLLNAPSMFPNNQSRSKLIIFEPLNVSICSPLTYVPTAAVPSSPYVIAVNDCHVSTETSWSTRWPDSVETLGSTPSLSSASPDSVALESFTVLAPPPLRVTHEVKKGGYLSERQVKEALLKEQLPRDAIKWEETTVGNASLPQYGVQSNSRNPSNTTVVSMNDIPVPSVSYVDSICHVTKGELLDVPDEESIGFDDIETCGPSPSLEELSRLTLFNSKLPETVDLDSLIDENNQDLDTLLSAPSVTGDTSRTSSLPSIESWTFGGYF